MQARPQAFRDTGAFGVQAHLFGDLWPHTGRYDGENRRLGGRQRHLVTNSYVLRIEGHGVKAPIAQRRRHLIDALIGRNMRTNIWVGRGHRRQARDQRDAIERRSHALTTGRVARSEHALKQPLQVPYADTRSSPAPTGTGLVKFVRLGGQAAFAVA